jgi:beta-ureidopropionase
VDEVTGAAAPAFCSTSVRLATITFAGAGCDSVVANRAMAVNLAAAAARTGADLVCLPEAFTAIGVPVQGVAEVAEPVPGPTTDALAAVAKAHRCHILCPIYTSRDGRFFNSAIWLDREGQVRGIYDKVHPSATYPDFSEFELGVTPGTGPNWFDFDFGRVGVQICMDACFPQSWAGLAEAGVRVVVWPSAFDGGRRLEALAALHNYYVVSAVRDGRARIVDPCGDTIEATGDDQPVLSFALSLDYVVAPHDKPSVMSRLVARRYGDRVLARAYAADRLLLIASTDQALRAETVAAEFRLTSLSSNLERHRAAYSQHRFRMTVEFPKTAAQRMT